MAALLAFVLLLATHAGARDLQQVQELEAVQSAWQLQPGSDVQLMAAAGPSAIVQPMTYTWGPPTPPMPSYPCKTTLPSTSGFQFIYVNPANKQAGTGDGTSANPYKKFELAWRDVPKYTQLTTGIVIMVFPGISGVGGASFYMEGGYGTATAPIIVMRGDSSTKSADIQSVNIFKCTYLYFYGITFKQPSRGSFGGGDVVHVASSDYLYFLNVTMIGQKGRKKPQETLKANQVKGIYVEDSIIKMGAWNALDYVAAQYGHVCRTVISDSSWCFYIKGGSSYFLIDSNTVTNCNEAGLRLGQGTGFEYMVPPWINYEAYGITVTNNVVTNTYGAALGVAGVYDAVIAYNSVYNSGQRSHMVEFEYGSRSCDNDQDLPNQCISYKDAGGWGPSNGGAAIPIPNKNVYLLNNLLVNTPKKPSKWSQFDAPAAPSDEFPGPAPVPNPSVADNVMIAGNVFVNRRVDGNPMDLGLSACTDSNPTCTAAKVESDNSINPPGLSVTFSSTFTLALTDASRAAVKAAWKQAAMPSFPAWSTPVVVPSIPSLATAVPPTDKAGMLRSPGNNMPGAML